MDENRSGVGELTPAAFKRRLESGEPLAVLDVREDHEREFATIPLPPTAVDLHVPIGWVSTRLSEIAGVALGRTLVIYCHHGVRSMAAATWLLGRGFASVQNLEGGIDAWSRRVDASVPRY